MRWLLFTTSLFGSLMVMASDIRIEGIEWQRDGRNYYRARFTLSWSNSWRNDKNYDAAWIFVKYTAPSYATAPYRHAKLSAKGHRLLHNLQTTCPDPVFEVPDDRIGLFIYPSAKYRGPVKWIIELALDTAVLSDRNFNPGNYLLSIYGIEMVRIPQGPFTAGEADTAAAWRNYSLFASDGNGRPGGLLRINSETTSIPVGKGKVNDRIPLEWSEEWISGNIDTK